MKIKSFEYAGNNGRVGVNPSDVSRVEQRLNSCTTITLKDGTVVNVKEDLDSVLKTLNEE